MSKHGRRDVARHTTNGWPDNLAPTPLTDAELLANRDSAIAAVESDQGLRSIPLGIKANPDPYHAEEKTFTTRPGGPDVATLMGEYINRYAIGTGASLLMVHHIPANNSFLFIWENP